MLFNFVVITVLAADLVSSARQCPKSWTLFKDDGTCLKAYTLKRQSFDEAKKACQKIESGSLVMIRDKAKNEFAFGLSKYSKKYFWIGLYSPSKNGTFKFMNGDTLTKTSYSHWHRGQPNNRGGKDHCVVVSFKGYWSNAYCRDKHYYVCQQPAAAVLQCPQNWFLFKDDETCLKPYMSKKLSFDEAKQACQTIESGSLVMIRDKAKDKFAFDFSKSWPQYFWMGLYSPSKNGTFKFMNGDTLTKTSYSHWYGGQPNNYRGEEHCVVSYYGYWFDADCRGKHNYVCQQPAAGKAVKSPPKTTPATATTKKPALQCPKSWTLFKDDGTCLKLYMSKKLSFDEAKKACQTIKSGSLVMIRDKAKYEFTFGFSKTWKEYFWMGLYSPSKNGTFKFMNGDTLTKTSYSHWYGGQPNNHRRREHCVVSYLGYWLDAECRGKHYYVCQQPATG